MIHENIFPNYTPRQFEEDKIKNQILKVQQDGISRAILIYGDGGVGKSFLLRNLSVRLDLKNIIFLGPVDIDDAEYWSITNLNRSIAGELSKNKYFKKYTSFLAKTPEVEQEKMGHETVLAHLRKGNAVFLDDYQEFIDNSKLTPIIILDTLESIRGTDTLTRLLIWLKKLPGTQLILAGRPVKIDRKDPVVVELSDKPKLEYIHLLLNAFSREECLQYLKASKVTKKLDDEEIGRIALMSKGHPLWLALSLYYLEQKGVPEEIEKLNIRSKDTKWPYRNGALHDAYLRRLVIPYLESEFWHEAIFRLGIVRRRVSKELWKQLMIDQKLPPDIHSWDQAWKKLLEFPWIRPRANRNFVTLQDALAEEMARRIIPFRDFDKAKRRKMWQSAVQDYQNQINKQKKDIAEKRVWLDNNLAEKPTTKFQVEILDQVLELDKSNLDLFLLQTTQMYYQMLCNFKAGCNQFIILFDVANNLHQFRFVELLWAEMQRFLPGESVFDPLEDIVKPEIKGFQQWYQENPEFQFKVITRVAKYLYEIGQAAQSEALLHSLWENCQGDLEQEYQILLLRGNAKVRFPGHARSAQADFEGALDRTRNPQAPTKIKRLEGKALSELGYYHRNMGEWHAASEAYMEALRKILLGEEQINDEQPNLNEEIETAKEIAGVQSQYAYVQALRGLYQDAHEMVDSALEIRKALDESSYVGMALSVKGEIFRYERRFYQAWQTYQDAEEIFEQIDNWGWLGLIRQQMAICLFQAYNTAELFPGHKNLGNMLTEAKDIAENALDFCQEYSRRSYPSALNRAGRIIGIGFKDYDQGLLLLDEGIDEAKAMADGWFWFANLIEYSELCFLAWEESKDEKYLNLIHNKEEETKQVYLQYQFSDLRGRWEILQGQLKVHAALQGDSLKKKDLLLNQAQIHFSTGYPLIAFGYVGSHGAIALHSEFTKLELLLKKLDNSTRKQWFTQLNKAWSQKTEGVVKDRQESSLLASLNRLYVKLQLTQKMKGGEV